MLFAAVSLVMPPSHVPVTPDGTPYTYVSHPSGAVTIRAEHKTGGNNRELFWSPSAPAETDSTVCATFVTGQGVDQEGVALRINSTATNTTAITVSRNVYGNSSSTFDAFNFHVWDTSNAANPYTLIGSVDLSSYRDRHQRSTR